MGPELGMENTRSIHSSVCPSPASKVLAFIESFVELSGRKSGSAVSGVGGTVARTGASLLDLFMRFFLTTKNQNKIPAEPKIPTTDPATSFMAEGGDFGASVLGVGAEVVGARVVHAGTGAGLTGQVV